MTQPEVPFEHLVRLTDQVGIFEHADGIEPRLECGYCLDDVARALIVVVREPSPPKHVAELTDRYLRFIESAQARNGSFHNRFGFDRRWEDRPTLDDCWGRALWALGTTVARSDDRAIRRRASVAFSHSARCRSPHRRAMAFAALGAAEILSVEPDDRTATTLLAAACAAVGPVRASARWPWPEPRLAYANAALAEALIAGGHHLGDAGALRDGLALLEWLLDVEMNGSHLSVTPVGGWALGEPRPAFDQQPIEVAAMADACARALHVTGDVRWASGLERAAAWFRGDNDAGVAMVVPSTGGGYDGLTPTGPNTNQGAESTLAMIATLQRARALVRS